MNCYSHFLLVLALLPLLRRTARARDKPTRITFVGSKAKDFHGLSRNPLGPDETVIDRFDDPNKYSFLTRYQDSKLLVDAWVRALGSKVSAAEVIVNNSCPGMLSATGINAGDPWIMRVVMSAVRRVMGRSLEEGAWMVVHAAAGTGAEGQGRFFWDNKMEYVCASAC